MIHMKFRTTIFLALFTLISSRACAGLKVICSMYPVYDFTRAITRELADVSLLLKPGTEPHEYEPSPQDIMALHDADVFVFIRYGAYISINTDNVLFRTSRISTLWFVISSRNAFILSGSISSLSAMRRRL